MRSKLSSVYIKFYCPSIPRTISNDTEMAVCVFLSTVFNFINTEMVVFLNLQFFSRTFFPQRLSSKLQEQRGLVMGISKPSSRPSVSIQSFRKEFKMCGRGRGTNVAVFACPLSNLCIHNQQTKESLTISEIKY